MDKVKGISIIIIAIVSVIVMIFIANMLLDTTGTINQGNFRVSDVIIESSASLTEVQDDKLEVKKLSDFVFDVSQTNTISILLEANTEASQIKIENLKIEEPILKGNMNICQKDYDKYNITPELTSIPIYLEREDGKYIIRLLLDNDKVIMDKSVDDTIEEIQYDATIFKTLNINTDDLKFKVSFDLVITDNVGKTVSTTISMNMPTDETFLKGMSILRQDASKYIFTIIK